MKKIEISTFLDYSFLSNVRFSKDGKYLAYTKAKANVEENNYDFSVVVYDTDKKEEKEFTSSGKDKLLFWLDEKHFLFQSKRDKSLDKKREEGETWTEYYLLSLEGGEAKAYLNIPYAVAEVQKQERGLVFTASYSNQAPYINSLEGEERTKAIAQQTEEKDYEVLDEIPFWSNGSGFTNKQRSRLYFYDEQKKSYQALTREFMNVEFFRVEGEKVLFIATEYQDKLGTTNALYEYDLRKESLTCLMEDKDYNFSYVGILEGKIFCAASDMKTHGINENHKLYFVKDGKLELFFANDTWLVSTVGSDCRLGGGKVYHLEKDAFYFVATQEDASVLQRVNAKGELEILTEQDGSVDSFDIQEGKLAYVGMKDYGLQEIYFGNFGQEQQVSAQNTKFFKEYSVQKPEKIYMESHGTKIEIYVIKPLGFEKGKQYPAILDIHGGPKTAYGNVFYHEMQVWANLGYFVFFTNPHGSDGRGNVFMDIRGKYGSIDYEDLMKATDLVLESYPEIDAKRVGVTGGSYGGFMTNWIIGHSDRFACAASQRSISNWISKFGTTDIGYYFNADQNQSTPWDRPEKLWEHSPLKYADKVKTPTLFIHSEEDYRCWLAEGLQMFTALKYHGVEARLCMFRGENHDLSRSGKPKHRVRRLTEITNWFEQYLKETK